MIQLELPLDETEQLELPPDSLVGDADESN